MSTLLNTEISNNIQDHAPNPEFHQDMLDTYPFITPKNYVKELGWRLAPLYNLICQLALKRGFCCASSKQLSDFIMIPENTIKNLLAELEHRGYLYRNTWQTPAGKVRHLVPKTAFLEYKENNIDKPKIPDKVRARYYAYWNITSEVSKQQTAPKKIATLCKDQSGPSMHVRTKLVRRLNNTKVLLNNRESNRDSASPLFKKEEIIKDLKNSGFCANTVTELLEVDEKFILSRKNPGAYINKLFTNEVIHERITRKREARRKEREVGKAKEAKAKRKKMGIRLCKKARYSLEQSGRTDISLIFDDIYWYANYRAGGSTRPMGWACEKDSVEQLERWIRKENINITNGETNE